MLKASPLEENYTLSKQEYVADSSVIEDAVRHGDAVDRGEITASKHVVISARPGTGKSYAALTELQRLSRRFVFVADTKALADDLASDHDLPVFYKGESLPPDDASLITIPHHVPTFRDPSTLLVVDEWHTLITAYGYKRKTINDLLDAFSQFKQVLGLTGTNYVEAAKAVDVTVHQDRSPIEIEPIRYTGLWSAIVNEVEARPDRTHFISLLDKSNLAEGLVDVFDARGYGTEEIVKFNSNTSDDEDIARFKETNVFADQVKIVLSTYTQGFSIKDDHYTVHIVPFPKRRHSPTDIAQVVHRFRSADNFDVKLYSNFQTDLSDLLDLEKFIDSQKRTAYKQIGDYRNAFDGVEPGEAPLVDPSVLSTFQKEVISDREGYRYCQNPESNEVNLITDQLGTDETQMYHNRYKIETKAAYQSVGDLREALDDYNLRLQSPRYDFTELEGDSEVDQESIDANHFEQQIEHCLQGQMDDVNGEVVRRVVFLSQYYEKDSIGEVMTEIGPRTEDWNRAEKRLKIWDPEVPLDSVSQEIYDRFDVGKVYANSQIQQKIRDIPGVPSEMSPNKVSRELRDRFETEKNWVEGNRGHEILSKGGCLPKSPKKMDGSASSSETPNRTGLPDFLQ